MHRGQNCYYLLRRLEKSNLILLTVQHCGKSVKYWKRGEIILRQHQNKIQNLKLLCLPCTEDDVGPLKWGLMWMFLGCWGGCWWCWGKLGGGELIIRGGSIWGRIGGERCAMCGGMRGWRGWRGCWASGRPCSWKGGGPLGRKRWCCWDCTCWWWSWWGGGIREVGC